MLAAVDTVLIGGAVFALGLIVFFLSIFVYFVRLVMWLFRVIFGQEQIALTSPKTEPRILCPRDNCGHVNRQGARYCALCGQALNPQVNAYG